MEKSSWYYIYSQRYYPFHFYIQEKIPQCFQAKGIFIDQSVFDEHLYKHEGEHFFSRITIKVETILQIIKEKRATKDTTPFFFTDCDILINPEANEYLQHYVKMPSLDILFQKEYKDQQVVNPGVMLIWPSEACLNFWESVLQDMKEAPTMEMTSINKLLPRTHLSAAFFDTKHVCSCITYETPRFCIYHILVKGESRETDIGNKMFESGINGHSMDTYIEMTRQQYGRLFM